MSKDNPTAQKAALLARMAADRVALRTASPPRNAADFRLSSELRPWALPVILLGLSSLKMPRAMKAPLRALAIITLKNRVQEVMQIAQSHARGTRSRPRAQTLPARVSEPTIHPDAAVRARTAPPRRT